MKPSWLCDDLEKLRLVVAINREKMYQSSLFNPLVPSIWTFNTPCPSEHPHVRAITNFPQAPCIDIGSRDRTEFYHDDWHLMKQKFDEANRLNRLARQKKSLVDQEPEPEPEMTDKRIESEKETVLPVVVQEEESSPSASLRDSLEWRQHLSAVTEAMRPTAWHHRGQQKNMATLSTLKQILRKNNIKLFYKVCKGHCWRAINRNQPCIFAHSLQELLAPFSLACLKDFFREAFPSSYLLEYKCLDAEGLACKRKECRRPAMVVSLVVEKLGVLIMPLLYVTCKGCLTRVVHTIYS